MVLLMTNNNILRTFLFASSLLVLTACSKESKTISSGTSSDTPSEETTTEVTSSMSDAESETYENEGTFCINLVSEHTEYNSADGTAKIATISLQTPQITAPDNSATQKINDDFLAHYEQTLACLNGEGSQDGDILSDFINSAYDFYEMYLSDNTDTDSEYVYTYYYDEQYKIQRLDNAVFSSLADLYSYAGGAHGSDFQYGVNYNMQTGEKLTIDDLTDDSAAFREYSINKIKEIAKDMSEDDSLFFPDYEDMIDSIITDDTFYLSQEGLVFISQEYVLQPYASGTICFTIPYEDLKGYLKDEYFPSGTSDSFKVNQVDKETVTHNMDTKKD